MSQRTTGRTARRARTLFITASLVASALLTFSPTVPTATADDGSSGPVASADPSPEPSPETSAVPEATPSPAPEPTAQPVPEPTAEPVPDAAPAPPSIAPAPAADPADGGSTSSAEPATGTAGGPHALRLDATAHGAAVAASADGAPLPAFTIETWFVRSGPGEAIAPVPVDGAGTLLRAIPLAARGTLDPSTTATPPEPGDRVAWLLGIDAVDGVLVAGFHDAAGTVHRVAGTTALTEDAWHHAAATFDGEVLRLYLDGHLDAAIDASGVDPDAGGGSRIALGTSVAADGQTERGAFDGVLDETRLWAVARSAAEIGADMRSPIDAGAGGLVAGWSMDDSAGSVLEGGPDPSVQLLLRGGTTWLDSPVPDPMPPPAPNALMAVPSGAAITLGWTPVVSDDLAGYRVRRTSGAAVDPSSAPLGGWTPIGATAFVDDSAAVGIDYRYVVVAVDRYGNESDPSPVAIATVVQPPGEPSSGPSSGPSGPDATPVAPAGLAVTHVIIGRPGDGSSPASYGPQDEPLAGVGRFTAVRVRFRIENRADAAVALTPTLEVRDLGGGQPAEFTKVPAGQAVLGMPVYTSREWVPVPAQPTGAPAPGTSSGGTVLGSEAGTIEVADLRTTGDPAVTLDPVAGVRAAGRNPAGVLDLPPGSFSEVEFSIRATADAPYGAGSAFRLTDGGVPLAGEVVATVGLGPAPPLLLTPGQRHGLAVGGPADASTVGAAVGGTEERAAAGAILYRLAPVAAPSDPAPADPADPAEVHGGSAAGGGTCAVCHDTHGASGRSLLARSGPQATVCFTCHDSAGTGAATRVEAEYLDPAVPADDPATGSYYRHDALLAGTDHSLAKSDEFGGRLDRHAECADCHDPHSVTPADSVQTAAGWTLSGRLGGASGVAVANGPAGAEPSYTFVDGATADLTLEYQLCFKCHSGFTTLPARQPDHPSRWAEDKAVELNPDNASYHPIEAAGRNATSTMTASLGGTSPYKLWELATDSTIRCVSCHGDSRVLGGSLPGAGSDLAPHAAASVVAADGVELNRGLLIQPYRDRVLKGSADAYDPQDSALCLSCHGQAPFVDASGGARADTAFRFHGLHVAGLAGKGAIAGDIDTPNAGLGNALCSECHYRIHSTASRDDFRSTTPQTGTDGGLVLFAPNVTSDDPAGTPLGGALDWTRTGPGGGTCTLTCHGKVHSLTAY